MINLLLCPYGNSMPTTQTGDILTIGLTFFSLIVLGWFAYVFITEDVFHSKGRKIFMVGFVIFWIITMVLNLVFYWRW